MKRRNFCKLITGAGVGILVPVAGMMGAVLVNVWGIPG